MIVTIADLMKMGACSEDVAKFKREFGSYAEVTLESLERAFKVKINVDWWAERVFGFEYFATCPDAKQHRRAR